VERLQFTRCPYDAAPIEAETDWRGPALLACPTCGAVWEWHNSWLRRIHEPDREAVRTARRRDKAPPVIRSAPDPALSEAMWREAQPPGIETDDDRQAGSADC
jgi:hypothetical protein